MLSMADGATWGKAKIPTYKHAIVAYGPPWHASLHKLTMAVGSKTAMAAIVPPFNNTAKRNYIVKKCKPFAPVLCLLLI